MEARVTFTKETLNKMEKGLTRTERGELRFKRLKELEDSGKLSKATSRLDIVRMMGFTDDRTYGTGYNWVSNLVRRGKLSETLMSTGPMGKMEFEYHIIKTPKYNNVVNHVAKPEVKPKVKPCEIPTSGKAQKVVIYYGELSIEIEQVDYSFLSQLVSSIVNKKGE